MKDDPVKVFITYSWDDKAHKKWVRLFADELLSNGIDVTIDQYDVELGDRLPHFMEKSIAEATYVLVVCTPNYKIKADRRNGGVGYESHLISGELIMNGSEKKYIPILRRGTIEDAIPSYLIGKYAYDLSEC